MLLPVHRRSVLLVLAICALVAGAIAGAVTLPPGTASAHNTLLSSDPADGAALPAAPSQITWVFDQSVPLDSMTVTLTDATGVRSQLSGSTHGAAGDTEVITPLPPLQPGAVSVRWRLVGPDGHPVTGRVEFTVGSSDTGTSITSPASTPADVPPASIAAPTPALESGALDQGDDPYATPSPLRWILRYASYLAIMAVVGILLTTACVWSGAIDRPVVRRLLSGSLVATSALAFVQLLVVASDVSGAAPWSSFGSIDAATTTDAGMALAIRIVLALTMWVVLFRTDIVHADVRWTAISLAGLGLLATWAFAGHARSMRWPAVGVTADVVHHAAAAAWIAGLAIIGWMVIPATSSDVLVPAVRRFSEVAAVSVTVLVVTGLVQTVRLVGSPGDLLAADHGRYLVAKLAVLALMLGIANVNRRRVNRHLDDPEHLGRHLGTLRRAVVAEFAIGLVIVAITAAMVVSPPSSSTSGPGAPTEAHFHYIM